MTAWWNEYTGLPFLENGRDRCGVDCWGLDRLVYAEKRGIILPCFGGSYSMVYATPCEQRAFCDTVLQGWAPAKIPHQPFDLIIITLGGNPFHTGLVTTTGYMLHIMAGCGSVVEKYDTRQWQRRIEGVYRYEQ